METKQYLRLVDFGLWVGSATTAIVVGVGGLAFLVGGDLQAAKVALFVVGFLLFGAGSFAIQPDRLSKLVDPFMGDTHQNRYEARLQEVGPLADHDLPFPERIDRSWKLFVTSLLVLLVSFGLEQAFDVAAVPMP